MQIRRKITIGVVISIFLMLGYWFWAYSYIEVVVANGRSDADITFVLANQDGNKTEIKSHSSHIKRLVRRGSYEVSVRQAETSYMAVGRAGGFFSTSSFTASLLSEKAREFVGNNPNACMYLLSAVVASTPCDSTVDELNIHMPASSNEPTYVKEARGPAALLEGIVSTKEGIFAIVSIESEQEGAGNYHALYPISTDGVLDVTNEHLLKALNGSKTYKAASYQDGWIAYNKDGSEILNFKSVKSTPSTIKIDKPGDASLALIDLAVFDEQIVLTYANQTPAGRNFDDPSGTKSHSAEFETQRAKIKQKHEVVVYSKNQSKHITFAEPLTVVRSCGTQELCVVFDGGKMGVYDISKPKPRLIYELTGVVDLDNSNKETLVVRNDGVYKFDITKKEGYLEYGLGSYRYCGIKTNDTSYVLCIADKSNKRLALRINQTVTNNDSIDKKIAELSLVRQVKNISIYGRYIYISPDVGSLQPNSQTGLFEYDKATVKNANSVISQEIDRLGISRSAYTIIKTIQ